jgi:glycosyltransferase involved in cell wall biosynthesis
MRVITRLNIGGPARQALLLTRELQQERGFNSELVSGVEGPGEGAFPPPKEHYVRIPTLERAVRPFADAGAYRSLARLMRAAKPHVVHTHMAKAGALGRVAAKRSGVPVVVHTFHGHVLRGYWSSPLSKAFVAIERVLARQTDALIAVSAAIRDELLSFGIGNPSQWHVIPVGLELDHLMKDLPPARWARQRLGLPEQGPLIGIVGRLVPIKDHETFLDAAAIVARAYPDATFVVAGDGTSRGMLEAKARARLGSRLEFLGWVEDLPLLYGALDVVAVTSRNEGTPVALIEAGAAGRPVVATRVGGVPDVVRDGATGLLTLPGEPHAVAAALITLLDHPERARSMGASARTWIAQRFTAERLVRDIIELYDRLLADRTSMPRK